MKLLKPRDLDELADAISGAVAEGLGLDVFGGGSKRGFGRPVAAEARLDLSSFAGVIDYEPAELVLTAGPGTPIAEIESMLAAADQNLAFEPPDYSGLWGGLGGTLGGVIGCNLSGPRRVKAGAARDHLLGFQAIAGTATIFKSGGRVVKNVTGYDLSKLITGSMGTLAAMTEISVKVLPRPATTWTLALRQDDDEAAISTISRALGSAHEISGAAHLPAPMPHRLGFERSALTLLRLEGPAPSVEARLDALVRELGDGEKVEDEKSLALWRKIRDVSPLFGNPEHAVWRVSTAPSNGASMARIVTSLLEADYFFDWGGGLLWLAVPEDEDGGAAVIRDALEQTGGGHATLFRASEEVRSRIPVFQPQAEALAALTRRIKHSFDPKGILNSGRMYPGL
jgi:glycolate oxidase FAD binding subunit